VARGIRPCRGAQGSGRSPTQHGSAGSHLGDWPRERSKVEDNHRATAHSVGGATAWLFSSDARGGEVAVHVGDVERSKTGSGEEETVLALPGSERG
jgi:hypothetical protein